MGTASPEPPGDGVGDGEGLLLPPHDAAASAIRMAVTSLRIATSYQPPVLPGRATRRGESAELLERQLTVVFPQEVQETLVVVRLEIEDARDDLEIGRAHV